MGVRPPRPCGCAVDAGAACPHYVAEDFVHNIRTWDQRDRATGAEEVVELERVEEVVEIEHVMTPIGPERDRIYVKTRDGGTYRLWIPGPADPAPAVPIVQTGDRVAIGADGLARVISRPFSRAAAQVEREFRREFLGQWADRRRDLLFGGLSNATSEPRTTLSVDALAEAVRSVDALRTHLDAQEAAVRREVLGLIRTWLKKPPTPEELERGTIVRLRSGAPPVHARCSVLGELATILVGDRRDGDELYFVPERTARPR